ncbi:MAG: hypothetical protein M0P69_17935 [Bacteroidales bacterium]|jgi:hypothetical protein|nr:hypothetical protein [Bacteroidales bacterium]
MTKNERLQLSNRIREEIAEAERRGVEYQEKHSCGKYAAAMGYLESGLNQLCIEIENGIFPRREVAKIGKC